MERERRQFSAPLHRDQTAYSGKKRQRTFVLFVPCRPSALRTLDYAEYDALGSKRALDCACSLLRVEWADFDFEAPGIAFAAFRRAVAFSVATAVATRPARRQPRQPARFRPSVDSRRFGRFRPIFPLIAIAEKPRVRGRVRVCAGSLLAVASVRSFRAATRPRELICAFRTRQSVQPAAEKNLFGK